MKNTFGFTILYWYNFQSYWQVFQISTDPDQQFSAPFKAGNSRQVQTCYKPTVQRKRKTATFSSLLRYRRNRSSHDLEPLSINAMMLAVFLHSEKFSLLATHKLLHFVLAEWNNAVITNSLNGLFYIHKIHVCLNVSLIGDLFAASFTADRKHNKQCW